MDDMWIFLRDSFLSVVQHDEERRFLLVRSRIRGDIERVFPEATVSEDHRADYRFVASVPRERVSHAVALRLQQIDYTSLNEMVSDTDRALAYDRVYSTMLDEQATRHGSELDPMPIYIPSYNLDSDREAEPLVPEAL